jgi:hypothetical protein
MKIHVRKAAIVVDDTVRPVPRILGRPRLHHRADGLRAATVTVEGFGKRTVRRHPAARHVLRDEECHGVGLGDGGGVVRIVGEKIIRSVQTAGGMDDGVCAGRPAGSVQNNADVSSGSRSRAGPPGEMRLRAKFLQI